MSLVGIDVGSGTVKAAAYTVEGALLAVATKHIMPRRAHAGNWETEPEEVWQAVVGCLRQIGASEAVHRDLPSSLAISASGREAFPVDRNGSVLGPCLMAADIRGADLEAATAARMTDVEWYEACGHIPERMDPINRLLWWRRNHPHLMERDILFLGWHEFLTLRMTGETVTDASLASKWLAYDLCTGDWSPQRLRELEIDDRMLPRIATWGTRVGTMRRSVVSEVDMPPAVTVGTGAFDASCAVLGVGAWDTATAALVSGSWEDLVVPTVAPLPPAELQARGLTVGPHPGNQSLAIFALSPNGTTIIDWATKLTGMTVAQLELGLKAAGPEPSPLMAVPHFSGATVPWPGARGSRGALLGLTLATSAIDVVKALMESIAFDLTLTFRSIQEIGRRIDGLRAGGGGTRSRWWVQLKADLLGIPIEVTNRTEPSTVGAALLAGLADNTYGSFEEATAAFFDLPACRHAPQPERASRYRLHLDAYQEAVRARLAGLPELSVNRTNGGTQ